MGTYRQEYTVLADAIVTNAIVVPMDAEVKAGEQPSRYYYTDSAAWDTGAQFLRPMDHGDRLFEVNSTNSFKNLSP